MTRNQQEVLKFKEYPEDSGGKEIYDYYFLKFPDYLSKYYQNPEFKQWDRWYAKYIEPAYNEERHDEMIKNFGYSDKKYHNFEAQQNAYSQLNNDDRLPDDVKKFIGFLAGASNENSFFKKYNITIDQWFEMKNWQNPYLSPNEDNKSINEILSYPYGINYFKVLLTQMPHWNR